MSAHTVNGTAVQTVAGAVREATATVTGSASYDAGGSTLDLSAAGLGPFTTVAGVSLIKVAPVGSHKYQVQYLAGTGPSDGKLTVYDMTQHPGAEVIATTNLSTTTLTLKVFGT